MPEQPYCELPPDWICEVLSPSTERLDRSEKLSIYLREQVTHVWLLSPQGRTLEVLRHMADGFLLVAVHAAPGAILAEPFGAVEPGVISGSSSPASAD